MQLLVAVPCEMARRETLERLREISRRMADEEEGRGSKKGHEGEE